MRSILAIALLPLALSRSIELHHRIISPTGAQAAAEPEWLPLGTIQADHRSLGRVQLDPTAQETKLDLSDDAIGGGAWYQVGAETDDGWVYGSTRACFLSTPPRVQLHLSQDRPTTISIKTNAPITGSCPSVVAGGLTLSPLGVKVDIQRPVELAGPAAAAPPATQPTNAATGLPEAPPPEKTFLQKYWLPLIGIAVFLIGQMTAPAEQQGAGGRAAPAK